MKTEILKVNPNEYGINENDADNLTKGLKTILEEREILAESYKNVISLEITEENTVKFKELRLLIRNNRTKGIEPWHKANKAFFLAGGRFVDAIKNKEIQENERMEEALLKAEKHFENLEKERIEKLNIERKEILKKYDSDTEGFEFGEYSDEVWNNYLTGVKTNYEAKIKAEKEAEQKRIEQERKVKLYNERKEELIPYWNFLKEEHKSADFGELPVALFESILDECKKSELKYNQEQEKIRLENERLQKEAEEKEKTRLKEEKERLEKEEKERLERERLAKIEADKQEKIRLENEKKLRLEREEKERLENELMEKQKAEKERLEAEKKKIQDELKKGDKAKVNDLIDDLQEIKTKYQFKSENNKKMYSDVGELLEKVINHIKK